MCLAAVCTVPAGRRGCRQGEPAASPGMEGGGSGLGGWNRERRPWTCPCPCPKSTEQDPTRDEVSVASFPKEPSMVRVPASISKSFHPQTLANTPQPHPVILRCLRDLGTIHTALPMSPRTAIVSLCYLVQMAAPEPVLQLGPQRRASGQPDLLAETGQGAVRKHVQPPPPHLCRGKESCDVNY